MIIPRVLGPLPGRIMQYFNHFKLISLAVWTPTEKALRAETDRRLNEKLFSIDP